MAGIQLQAAATADIALSAATAKTVLQVVAAANHRIKVLGYGVAFDGVSTTAEPVTVELKRQTTAGTMSALTLTKRNSEDGETIQSSAQHTATAEPTTTDLIEATLVHPQQGVQVFYPLGQEIVVPGGGRLGMVITAPAGVNCRPFMVIEE
jgi:hypothetical protein